MFREYAEDSKGQLVTALDGGERGGFASGPCPVD